MSNQRIMFFKISINIVAGFLIAIGIFGLYYGSVANAKSISKQLPLSSLESDVVRNTSKTMPDRIVIKSIGMDLQVKNSDDGIKSGNWTINETDAFFVNSPTPILYGHNTESVFASLNRIKAGEEMIIIDKVGLKTKYSYTHATFVEPDDTRILKQHKPKTIILLTCEGIFSQTRRLAYFEELS